MKIYNKFDLSEITDDKTMTMEYNTKMEKY